VQYAVRASRICSAVLVQTWARGFSFQLLIQARKVLRGCRRERSPQAGLVDAAVADMRDATPGLLVSDIARRHAVSVRTLQRLFARYLGVGPKWVLRRYRLHKALEATGAIERPDWTRLALDLGYFDHAHFMRDFHAVAGRTPAQYEREQHVQAA